jgi:hypothetical protein
MSSSDTIVDHLLDTKNTTFQCIDRYRNQSLVYIKCRQREVNQVTMIFTFTSTSPNSLHLYYILSFALFAILTRR